MKKNVYSKLLLIQGSFMLKTMGFLNKLLTRFFDVSKRLFELPLETKESYTVKNNVGYTPIGQERLDKLDLIDYKEAFNFPAAVKTTSDDQLPSTIKENMQATEKFTRTCHDVGGQVLRSLAAALCLDSEYFVNAHSYDKKSSSIFRLLHYPSVPDSVNSATTIRAGSHSDYGTITLLFQQLPSNSCEEMASGLQVLIKGSWHDVPAKKGCIVVNIADLLSFWTEGRLCSAVHRVILPEDDLKSLSRYTIAFFIHPNDEYIILPTPSPLPAPFPAKKDNDGNLVASFGPSPFTYNQNGKEYLWRRLNSTYTSATY
ncbi:hypothetical protein DSO57_1010662 [Entomophthora muscae]|uniref:Uncharacterized protein n=2 Tax=Entomophthora muscae TaxID=34485 RepID=A0ACC2RXF0_9FUNG|nr:hypothetical protein DSO57_1010662 [Entomophthora muscae]